MKFIFHLFVLTHYLSYSIELIQLNLNYAKPRGVWLLASTLTERNQTGLSVNFVFQHVSHSSGNASRHIPESKVVVQKKPNRNRIQ